MSEDLPIVEGQTDQPEVGTADLDARAGFDIRVTELPTAKAADTVDASVLHGVSAADDKDYQYPFSALKTFFQSGISVPVDSVFGRTGDVVAAEGDYNLDQLGDVNLSGAQTGQVLTYNNGTWINQGVSFPAINLGYTLATNAGLITNTGGDGATIPLVDGTYAGLMSPDQKTKLDGIDSGAGANVPTNLGNTPADDSVTVTSSTGDDTVIAAATTSEAGVMTKDQVTKLAGIADGAQVNVATNLTYTASTTNGVVNSSTGSNATIPLAVNNGNAGLFSGTDKKKLDGIADGAGQFVGTNLSNTPADSTVEVQSSTGNNTTLPAATQLKAGVMTKGDKTKLDGIEAGAGVSYWSRSGTILSPATPGDSIGIGTTTVNANLQIDGANSNTPGDNHYIQFSTNDVPLWGFRSDADNSFLTLDRKWQAGSDWEATVSINRNQGNVHIGGTLPSAPNISLNADGVSYMSKLGLGIQKNPSWSLDVYSTDSGQARFINPNTDTYLRIQPGEDKKAGIQFGNAPDFEVVSLDYAKFDYDTGTERFFFSYVTGIGENDVASPVTIDVDGLYVNNGLPANKNISLNTSGIATFTNGIAGSQVSIHPGSNEVRFGTFGTQIRNYSTGGLLINSQNEVADSDTNIDVNMPGISTAGGRVRFFRGTDTTGECVVDIHKADGTTERTISLRSEGKLLVGDITDGGNTIGVELDKAGEIKVGNIAQNAATNCIANKDGSNYPLQLKSSGEGAFLIFDNSGISNPYQNSIGFANKDFRISIDNNNRFITTPAGAFYFGDNLNLNNNPEGYKFKIDIDGLADFKGKVQSVSTEASDPDSTLTTKDYVDSVTGAVIPNGSAAGDRLRWDGSKWEATDLFY